MCRLQTESRQKFPYRQVHTAILGCPREKIKHDDIFGCGSKMLVLHNHCGRSSKTAIHKMWLLLQLTSTNQLIGIPHEISHWLKATWDFIVYNYSGVDGSRMLKAFYFCILTCVIAHDTLGVTMSVCCLVLDVYSVMSALLMKTAACTI